MLWRLGALLVTPEGYVFWTGRWKIALCHLETSAEPHECREVAMLVKGVREEVWQLRAECTCADDKGKCRGSCLHTAFAVLFVDGSCGHRMCVCVCVCVCVCEGECLGAGLGWAGLCQTVCIWLCPPGLCTSGAGSGAEHGLVLTLISVRLVLQKGAERSQTMAMLLC